MAHEDKEYLVKYLVELRQIVESPNFDSRKTSDLGRLLSGDRFSALAEDRRVEVNSCFSGEGQWNEHTQEFQGIPNWGYVGEKLKSLLAVTYEDARDGRLHLTDRDLELCRGAIRDAVMLFFSDPGQVRQLRKNAQSYDAVVQQAPSKLMEVLVSGCQVEHAKIQSLVYAPMNRLEIDDFERRIEIRETFGGSQGSATNQKVDKHLGS